MAGFFAAQAAARRMVARTDGGGSIVNVEFIGPEGEEQAGIPVGRHGQPRDIADAAVFLASPMASFVNGASFVVDGGATAVG